MKISPYFITILLIIACSFEKENHPYFHEEDLNNPIKFEENTISTTNGISFSKEGKLLYISKNIEKKFDNGRSYASIFVSRYEDKKWKKPVEFELDLAIDAYHPVLSPNNQKLFFNSRSNLDSGNKSVKHDIWVMQKNGANWNKPQKVKGVNSSSYDSYPSIAKNGNMYFNSDRDGGKGSMDIYFSKYLNGNYQKPENISQLNSSDSENDLVIDPEERFIIYNRYFFESKGLDLFISFRNNNEWTKPRLLDNINSEKGWELTPSLSPDGKYFFYELNSKIMQIDLAALIYEDEIEELGRRKRKK